MKRLQYRIASAAEFTAKNPVLAKDEIGIERDTGKEKLGDGSTKWSLLAYLANPGTDASKVSKSGDTMVGNLVMASGATVSGLPNATSGSQAVNKDQLDTKVTLTGNETISGTKTFSNDLTIDKTGAAVELKVKTNTGQTYITTQSPGDQYRFQTINGQARFVERVQQDTWRLVAVDDTGDMWSSGSRSALLVDRTTGKVTVGAVGATAGLEFGASGPRMMMGTGSPEGVVTAPVGSIWLNQSGGASTTLYVKTSGTGNTGWTAK